MLPLIVGLIKIRVRVYEIKIEFKTFCFDIMLNYRLFQKFGVRLVCVFKQQFLVFLEIYVGEKVCRNTYNVV